MTTKSDSDTSTPVENTDNLRACTSEDTVAAPDDLPAEYDYGSGKISDYSRDNMMRMLPAPSGNQTVLNMAADPENVQVLCLWEEGNVPAKTSFTEDMTGYFDEWDFRPYVTAIPVRKGVQPKGAVVLMAGGEYQFRGNYTDSLPTAAALRELDDIPAHASAAGMIYSFYGRLSVGNMDPDWLTEGELPPTFYVYGTEDPFYRQFQQQYDVIKGMGIPTSRIVLDGWPHGFGSDGGWVSDYAAWLEQIFE